LTGRGVIFDLDDTLYARAHFVQSGFAAVARHVEARWGVSSVPAFLTLCRASLAGRRGQEFQALCDSMPVPHAAVPELVEVVRSHVPALMLPDESRAVLLHLRSEGWRVGILTNGDPAVQARKVEALGLAPLVDAVLYAAEHADGGKPAAGAFTAALAALGTPAGRTACVGDDLRCDVYGARAAGLRTIRVCGPGAVPPISDDADDVVERMAEVPGALARLLPERMSHAA